MSIIITGLEMPTERESFNLTIKYNGLVFDTESGMQVAEAHELPPHGRLGDLDELEKSFREDADAEWNRFATPLNWADAFDDVADIVADAPTIIPADPAEEGE